MQGSVVNDQYVLDEGSISPSGKSSIFTAHEKDNPTAEPVVIKFSQDNEALEQELVNFDALNDDLFVEAHTYMEECYFDGQNGLNCEPLHGNAALVMEKGAGDLKQYLNKYGALQEPELRNIAWTAVQCLRDMHSKQMVWTDLKSQNLVVFFEEQGGSARHPQNTLTTVKGIDVESAVPHGSTPLDYTPRQSPPELAIRFLQGKASQMPVDYHFDIWSLGVLLHEMATGKHYFEGQKDHEAIATQLKNTGGLNIQEVADIQLRDVIHRCLHLDPSQRPTIEQVAQHSYFTQPQHVQ